MARQSIPRFDLYGELGVDPSADMVAIEAAYRDLIDRESGLTSAASVRRTARLRLARDWLTDADLRERYDASRARSAARAAGKAGARADANIPWPAADLARAEAEAAAEADQARARAEVEAEMEARAAAAQARDAEIREADARDTEGREAEAAAAASGAALTRPDAATRIAWSATPAAPDPMERADDAYFADPRARRRSRGPAVAFGRVAIVVALGIAAYLITANLGLLNFAAANPTASAPSPATPEPTTAAPTTIVTQPPPTTTPSIEPTPPDIPDIPVAELQQGAYDAIQALMTAAAAGDVETAQTYLGDSAPLLRPSGLRQAQWPLITGPADLTIAREGELYVATNDVDRATSADGHAWTFEYGDRPLTAYRSPGKDVHDLWWVESDGEHHIYLRLTVATLSPQTFRATFTWTFDPARPEDANYFRRAAIDVTSLSFDDGAAILTSGQPVGIVDSSSVTTSSMLATPLDGALPEQVVVQVTVTNPRTEGGAGRPNPTIYTIPIR